MDDPLLVKDTDNIVLPEETNFKYTVMNVAGPYLHQQPNEILYSGCDCKLPSCQPQCRCITRYGQNYDVYGHFIKGPSTTQSKPVFECNASCKCGPECINRVVQNGLRYRLEVFATGKKGYGLKSAECIPKDSFVCEYAGEVLTLAEAKRRSHDLGVDDMNYILVVRECLSKGKVITTPIDPTYIGNIGRFINHSCQPNLYLITVRVDNDIPRVGLFAMRDINAGEELTYSYWGDHIPPATYSSTTDHQRTPCLCGSQNCQGFLPFIEDLFQ